MPPNVAGSRRSNSGRLHQPRTQPRRWRARLRHWEDAVADCTRALELSDASAGRWRLRAELGKWDEAIDDFTQALERDPANRRARSGLGMARFRIGQIEEAGDDWKRAIDLFDKSAKPTKPETRPLDWSLKVEWEMLRKQAERLLHDGKK